MAAILPPTPSDFAKGVEPSGESKCRRVERRRWGAKETPGIASEFELRMVATRERKTEKKKEKNTTVEGGQGGWMRGKGRARYKIGVGNDMPGKKTLVRTATRTRDFSPSYSPLNFFPFF